MNATSYIDSIDFKKDQKRSFRMPPRTNSIALSSTIIERPPSRPYKPKEEPKYFGPDGQEI
jgi:hypothetical protein